MYTIRAVWSDKRRVGKLAKVSSSLEAWLAFAAAVAGVLALLSPITPWIAAVLAVFAGAVKQVSVFAGRQQAKLEVAFKRTPPQVDAYLGRLTEGGYTIFIRPLNEVPFVCGWTIVTLNNNVVSDILLEQPKIVPRQDTPLYNHPISLQFDKVQAGYIELRFKFRSSFADNFPSLNLSGDLVRRYRLLPDNDLSPVE